MCRGVSKRDELFLACLVRHHLLPEPQHLCPARNETISLAELGLLEQGPLCCLHRMWMVLILWDGNSRTLQLLISCFVVFCLRKRKEMVIKQRRWDELLTTCSSFKS